MMLYQLIFVLLATSIELQCYAFREIRRRSNSPCLRSNCHIQRRHDIGQHKSISILQLLSIQGGNVNDDYDEDEYDDDIAYEFISTFESELAEIRREAEREAEEEMQKLRSLIERRTMLEEVERESDQYDNEGDLANEPIEKEDAMAGAPTPVDEEKPSASPKEVTDNVEIRSDEPPSDHVPSKVVGESDIEVITDDEEENIDLDVDVESNKSPTDGEPAEADVKPVSRVDAILSDDETVETIEEVTGDESDTGREDGDFQHVNFVNTADVSTGLVESDIELGEASPSLDTQSTMEYDDGMQGDGFQDTKPKVPKKKKKKSSKTSKSKGKKKRVKVSEESMFSDLGVATTLAQSEDELIEPPQSGIMFYLRSDLGRAIGLFIATVLLALLTQRMQRQLEAQGN